MDQNANNPADTKQTRVVKKTVPTDSFFNFFDPPKAPEADDDDAASDVEERLELDYQLGEDIKEKLIPRAIDWFTGEALQFEEVDDDLAEGDFEDEDDEDDDEEGSEERDDEEESDEEVCVHTCTTFTEANLHTRMIIQNLNRRLQSASKARSRSNLSGVTTHRSHIIGLLWSKCPKKGADLVLILEGSRCAFKLILPSCSSAEK